MKGRYESMGILTGTLILILATVAHTAAPIANRCDQITAEFREMEKLTPVSCEEAKHVHKQFQTAYMEVNQYCRRLEARVNAGATKLALGTEDEMRAEATAIRQKDMEERFSLTSKIAHELLLTPIDTDSPARPPIMVADACRDELDAYAKIRRVVLTSFSRFFQQIDLHADSLFQQASDRALPPGTAAARDPGR